MAETQQVDDFFKNTVFANADSCLKTLVYDEINKLECKTLCEMYNNLVQGFRFFDVFEDENEDTSLYELYDIMFTRFVNREDWTHLPATNKDLTTGDIERLITHIILAHQPDKDVEYRPFINLLSLLLSQFVKTVDSFVNFLFKIIITEDDICLYKLYYNIFESFERTYFLESHYDAAERVLNKRGESRIVQWLTPKYFTYLRD